MFVVLAALVGGAFSIYYSSSLDRDKGPEASGHEDLTKKEEEKLIKENAEKFQPKITDNTRTSGVIVSAKSAIVVDQETNEIIYAKNIERKLPPASIIKILTLSLALELFNPEEKIEISNYASEQISNKINMKAGEKLKMSDLLYGLMMISANDAAYAIADASENGFEGFINLANEKIRLLGLNNTTMKNPAGLDDPGQISTTYDMATITRYALTEHPEIVDYAGKTTEHSVQMTEENEPHWWFGHLSHMLTAYPHMIAAKTGYTDEAGNTYVGIAEKSKRRLVVVMLGSKNTEANEDVKKLLDFGFANLP